MDGFLNLGINRVSIHLHAIRLLSVSMTHPIRVSLEIMCSKCSEGKFRRLYQAGGGLERTRITEHNYFWIMQAQHLSGHCIMKKKALEIHQPQKSVRTWHTSCSIIPTVLLTYM